MRPPTREDCRLEPGLKGQPGGTFYWWKKEQSSIVASRFHSWCRFCRCQQNPAPMDTTTLKYQDKAAHLRLSSEEASVLRVERSASSSGSPDGWAFWERGPAALRFSRAAPRSLVFGDIQMQETLVLFLRGQASCSGHLMMLLTSGHN